GSVILLVEPSAGGSRHLRGSHGNRDFLVGPPWMRLCEPERGAQQHEIAHTLPGSAGPQTPGGPHSPSLLFPSSGPGPKLGGAGAAGASGAGDPGEPELVSLSKAAAVAGRVGRRGWTIDVVGLPARALSLRAPRPGEPSPSARRGARRRRE